VTRTHKVLSEILRSQGVKHRNEAHFHPPGWEYGYTADIYVPDYRALIEVDGPSHNGRAWRDRIRDRRFYNDLGICTIRIRNSEVERDPYRAARRVVSRLKFLGR